MPTRSSKPRDHDFMTVGRRVVEQAWAKSTSAQLTGLLHRSLVKWVALYVPVPWPKRVPTRPEMGQFVGGTAPSDFETDRDTLLALIERFTNSNRDFEWSPHPTFGKMPDPEWLRWGYLHTDHHLRQFGV